MKRAAAVVFPLLSLGLGDVAWGQSSDRPAMFHRAVPRDSETKVASQTAYKTYDGSTNCMTRYLPTIELVTPPQHGTIRFDTADVGVPAGSGCSNSVTGTVILYRPNPAFVGKDQFTYKMQGDPMAMDHIGTQNPLHRMIVTVQ